MPIREFSKKSVSCKKITAFGVLEMIVKPIGKNVMDFLTDSALSFARNRDNA